MTERLISEHVYTGKVWVHIVSPNPVSDEIRSALLYANDVLCAQYTLRAPKFVQVVTAFPAGVLITELL